MRLWHLFWSNYHRKRCKRPDGYTRVNHNYDRLKYHQAKLNK